MNGVAWMKLGSFAKVEKRRNKLQKDYTPYSITQSGLIPTKEYFKEKTNITSKNTSNYFIVHKDWFVYSPSRVDVGSLNYLRVDGPVIVSPIDVVFSIDTNLCLPQYLFYYLKSQYGMKQIMDNREGVEGMGRKNLPFERFSNIKIPIIPIDIQQAIVNQLDTFTTLISRLESELELRQKQYEHYREDFYEGLWNIATNDNDCNEVQIKSFSELGEIVRGKRFVRDDIKGKGQPCIHYGDMYTYYGISAFQTKTFLDYDFPKTMRYASKGDVVIVGAGENNIDIGVGVAWMGNEKAAVHDACYILKHKINAKYISHYLRTKLYHQQLKKFVSEGKICSFSAEGLGKVYIPVPKDKPRQQQIVEKLDAFEQLIAALKREIALRQKQYEYYREKLLTFE